MKILIDEIKEAKLGYNFDGNKNYEISFKYIDSNSPFMIYRSTNKNLTICGFIAKKEYVEMNKKEQNEFISYIENTYKINIGKIL